MYPQQNDVTDFNPRSREGATITIRIQSMVLVYFNPRSREGAIGDMLSKMYNCGISIHAPAKERLRPEWFDESEHEFQSTLPRRSDRVGVRRNIVI